MAQPHPRPLSGVRIRPRETALSGIQRSILLTVLYADLFDYPLREEELYRRLVLRRCDRKALLREVDTLAGRYLTVGDGYVTWVGREHLIGVRRRRSAAAAPQWNAAVRYARWLACVPFVRMAAVSGSLAAGNAEERSDVDLFCIVESGRLWVARLFIVPLSRLTRRFPRLFARHLCPNYILTVDALSVEDRNLFTAHEIVQAVPLWDDGAYDRFRRANGWVGALLPHRQNAASDVPAPARPALTRFVERLLTGPPGDLLDGLAYRASLALFKWRARRRGWRWDGLRSAYQRGRYLVPEGGYLSIVRRLFAARAVERLGLDADDSDLQRLFPCTDPPGVPACYDWEGLFEKEYGREMDDRSAKQKPVFTA